MHRAMVGIVTLLLFFGLFSGCIFPAENRPPVPYLAASATFVDVGEEVIFSGNESVDKDGEIKRYFWDFGDGTNGTGMVTSHIFHEKKTFRVTLTVTDNDGARAAFPLEVEIIFREYQVEWIVDKVLVDAPSGMLLEGESDYPIINIDLYNITRIRFNLTWDDDKKDRIQDPVNGVPNDDFILNITSPDETESYQEGPSSSQKIVILAPETGFINPVPTEFIIEGESENAVYNEIALNNTSTGGTGNWKVNITLVYAGGRFPPTDTDDRNSWQLMVECYYYTPIVTKLE